MTDDSLKLICHFGGKPGIMARLTGLVPVCATLAQSAEQTLRKRQVKGSNPLGGLGSGQTGSLSRWPQHSRLGPLLWKPPSRQNL